MSNYEWIKSLSIKELAEELVCEYDCDSWGDSEYKTSDGRIFSKFNDAIRYEIDWLKKEHKN